MPGRQRFSPVGKGSHDMGSEPVPVPTGSSRAGLGHIGFPISNFADHSLLFGSFLFPTGSRRFVSGSVLAKVGSVGRFRPHSFRFAAILQCNDGKRTRITIEVRDRQDVDGGAGYRYSL